MTGLNHVIRLAQLTWFSLTWPRHSTVFLTSGSCWSWKVMVLTAACMPGSGTSWQDAGSAWFWGRGTRSNWSSVTSGTSQGTILGPFIFLIYINDITNCVSSTVKLYADDTNIYRQIVDPIKDPQLLQMDLSNLMEWARKWQLRFKTDKCESMRKTHTRDKSI